MGLIRDALIGTLLGLHLVFADVWRKHRWPYFQRMALFCIIVAASSFVGRYWYHRIKTGKLQFSLTSLLLDITDSTTTLSPRWTQVFFPAISGAAAFTLFLFAAFVGTADPSSVATHASCSMMFCVLLVRTNVYSYYRLAELALGVAGLTLVVGHSRDVNVIIASSFAGVLACDSWARWQCRQLKGLSRFCIAFWIAALSSLSLAAVPSYGGVQEADVEGVAPTWEVLNALLMLSSIAVALNSDSSMDCASTIVFSLSSTVVSHVALTFSYQRETAFSIWMEQTRLDEVTIDRTTRVIGMLMVASSVLLGGMNSVFEEAERKKREVRAKMQRLEAEERSKKEREKSEARDIELIKNAQEKAKAEFEAQYRAKRKREEEDWKTALITCAERYGIGCLRVGTKAFEGLANLRPADVEIVFERFNQDPEQTKIVKLRSQIQKDERILDLIVKVTDDLQREKKRAKTSHPSGSR